MERSLTKTRDIDKKILDDLDDKSLLNFCKTSKYGEMLCQDETFWKRRFISKFGAADKNPDRKWKDFYLKIVYYLDKYKNNDRALFNVSTKGIRNLDIIKFFLVRGANVNRGLNGASKGGHIDLVDYFIEREADDYLKSYIYAENGGHKDLLDYFHNKFHEKGIRVFNYNYNF
jgi:hypothetical protein